MGLGSVGLATGWSWVRILLRQHRFGTLAIPFTLLCQCLSEETLKAVGPLYLVSMPERRGSVVVSTPTYHGADRGSNPAWTRRDY